MAPSERGDMVVGGWSGRCDDGVLIQQHRVRRGVERTDGRRRRRRQAAPRRVGRKQAAVGRWLAVGLPVEDVEQQGSSVAVGPRQSVAVGPQQTVALCHQLDRGHLSVVWAVLSLDGETSCDVSWTGRLCQLGGGWVTPSFV
jgi:hypothetical protein